jgi:ligand-binding sensor domain-containing protein/signal transduction histidine kinase
MTVGFCKTFRATRHMVLLFVSMLAWADTTAPFSVPQYTRNLWRTQDGLPENIVQAVVEDSEGYLWIGTTGGLVLFDGAHFQPFRDKSGRTIPDNSIFCLLSARDGSIWAGTEGGGLVHIHSGSMQVFSAKEGLTNSFVRSVTEDAAGHVWAGTDNGLFEVEGARARRVDNPSQSGPLPIHAVYEDSAHRLWVGGDRLFDLESGREVDHTLPGAYSQNKIKTILQTKDHNLWIGTVSGLLQQVDGKFQSLPQIHATVRSLRQTSDGTLWIGTIGAGLWNYRKGLLTRVDKEGLLPSNTVLDIYEDSNLRIWVATQNGLVRLEETPVSLVSLPGGGDSDFGTISGDLGGDVWMVAQRAFRIHNGVAQGVTFSQLPNISLRNLFRARDGSLWVGTDGSGAYHLVGNRVIHYAAPDQLTNNFIRGFLEAANGEIWIATDEGVSWITPSGVHKYNVNQGLVYFSTRSLCEDRNHDIWIGTEKGVSHWHLGHFLQDVATQALQEEKVWSILQDRQGTLWFGTRDHGLYRYRDGRMQQYTTAQGLATNSIYQLLQDKSGRFWLTGPDSIASIPEADFAGDFPPADRPLSIRIYKMPYGADGAQLYGGREPSGYVGPDDSVWFPTSKGAAHVILHEYRSAIRPKMRIVNVTQDGHELPTSAEILRLSASASRLVFGFAPILLGSQDGIRFRYQLENFDKGWIFAGSTDTATYTNLPAGRYRFRVQIFDLSHPELASEASIEIIKAQYFYKTWWFLSLCFLVLAGLTLMIYRLRVGQIRKSFSAVLEERSRLAREMHDTVIQGCTGISALLEAIASMNPQSSSTEGTLLAQARTQIVTTINEARDAVWNLRHDKESAVELQGALRGIAMQASRAFGIPVVCPDPELGLNVPSSVAHELLMVVREAVANAGSHANATEVQIQTRIEGKDLLVSVEDNGCGFIPEEKNGNSSGHFGLIGMRERMQKVGGNFQVHSVLQKGTSVELRIRRSRLASTTQTKGELA